MLIQYYLLAQRNTSSWRRPTTNSRSASGVVACCFLPQCLSCHRLSCRRFHLNKQHLQHTLDKLKQVAGELDKREDELSQLRTTGSQTCVLCCSSCLPAALVQPTHRGVCVACRLPCSTERLMAENARLAAINATHESELRSMQNELHMMRGLVTATDESGRLLRSPQRVGAVGAAAARGQDAVRAAGRAGLR